MHDENPNNIWENVDILEGIIESRLRLIGLTNEGSIARIADQLLGILRDIQEETGPLVSTDNYQVILTSYLYVLGGEIDGDKILSEVMDVLDKKRLS